MSAGTYGFGGNIAPPYGVPPLGGDGGSQSVGGAAPMYGAPPAGAPSTAGTDTGGGVPVYGAAPQD
jgi:hypothetical protein